ncbi:hypothetical protein [uncultured Methylobacterium sp.]|uniref:hypothetical protein n=1 Tax=uncultured Methylobacterium sp. TaxID=157278 RepID=UPI0035CB5252
MRQTAKTEAEGQGSGSDASLHARIAEAVRNRATPISQLLRLMSALDAEGGANENLRLQLRARIGAPLDA